MELPGSTRSPLNSRQLAQVTRILEGIDAGDPVPDISGPPGAFLRRYATQRNDALNLALDLGVDIRRDGKLDGASLGNITVVPLEPGHTRSEGKTVWGEMEQVAVICPELLTVVSFRTWMTSASGREAMRILRTLEPNEAMFITGNFLWSPPGMVVAGTADFDYTPSASLSWETAPYLKATGDDLLTPPHTLDIRRINLARPMLAQVRCIVGVRTEGHSLAVPSIMGAPLRMRLPPTTAPDQAWIPKESDLLRALLFRWPWDSEWSVWRYQPCTPQDAWQQLVDWLSFMRWLRPSFAAELTDDLGAIEAGLARVGVQSSGSGSIPESNSPTTMEASETRLAKHLAETVRFGGRIRPAADV